jgi:hypothetical protein
MASPTRRARNALKMERSCEVSRLEEHIIATAYELATPIFRHPIPNAVPDRPPASVHGQEAERSQRQAGGSQA